MSRGPLVVIGDSLLDVDVEGRSTRLCPEAPVPVVDVEREWQRPGGAGLAAKLAARSAHDVVLVTALGDDEPGEQLRALLRAEVEVIALPLHGRTPVKKRVRVNGQSVTRLDEGDGRLEKDPLPESVAALLDRAEGVLVADYGRGFTAHGGLRRLLTEAARRVPVVWDPHPRGVRPVLGTRLVTPNDKEAAALAQGTYPPDELARVLRREWCADAVAVTLGADGAVLAQSDSTQMIVVPDSCRVAAGSRPDTCGAGDRFASAAAAALFDGAATAEAVTDAVESAARFVTAGAASSLSEPPPVLPAARLAELSAFELVARTRERGGRVVATGGCFDLLHPGHVALLEQARAMGDALVVCLNSDASVRRLKGPTRPILAAADRARLLTALSFVDAVVVFDGDTPERLLDRLAPDVWVKGGDYADTGLPEAEVVRRHGGRIELVPVVEGYSTTRLVAGA